MESFKLALAGNPNCGKTTLFNQLTGAHQKVGNWPGVTVERKEGAFELSTDLNFDLSLKETSTSIELVDLPGVYSFEQTQMGMDEQIARTYLKQESPDLILNVVDASNLERNLLLTAQLSDLNIPIILVINMMDVAQAQGIEIDIKTLSERLGIKAIAIVAAKGEGIEKLKKAISIILNKAEKTQNIFSPPIATDASEATLERFKTIHALTQGLIKTKPLLNTTTNKIDAVVLNRWLGIPIFLFMMYLMFTLAINLGAVFIDFFDILFGALFVDGVKEIMLAISAPEWLTVIIADGLGGGIQLVATFVPVIGFLYLCLSILEDTGYMSRAAFVVDRVMAGIGLPGNAFVPLIVGFGCNVPSVMAARSLNREQDRLLTIAMAPFMSCGARLTVYALFAAAFFPDNGPMIVFSLYILGIVMAVLTGWIFKKALFQGTIAPSYQEMPIYHVPVMRNILFTTWHRLRNFLMRAGKTIVAVMVVLSFLNSWGTDGSFGNQNSRNSVLSEIGRTITPAFKPIGLEAENWPATVGIFTGVFAKEAVVGTLNALYNEVGDYQKEATEFSLINSIQEAFLSVVENGKDLASVFGDPLGLRVVSIENAQSAAAEQDISLNTLTTMERLFSGTFAAFCYLVFILLYTPCVAVMGAMSRESGAKWTGVVVVWSTGLAYWAAATLYQIGTFSQHPLEASITLLIVNGAFFTMVLWLKSLGKKAAAGKSNLIPMANIV